MYYIPLIDLYCSKYVLYTSDRFILFKICYIIYIPLMDLYCSEYVIYTSDRFILFRLVVLTVLGVEEEEEVNLFKL